MITTLGRGVLLRSLTPQGESFAASMGFGISGTAPAPSDEALGYEVVRSPVDIIDYSLSTSALLVRSIVPTSIQMDIHEVGLYTLDDRSDEEFISNIITNFDDSEDDWVGFDSLETNGVRSGNAAFRLDMAGGSGLVSNPENMIPFNSMASSSTIALAYQRLGGAATATFRAHVSALNYRAYSFSLGAGFGVERWARSQFTETGTAPWDQIAYLEIEFSGGGPILLEGLRQDELSESSDVLVARYVPLTPVQSTGISEVQFEYALEVVFS